MEERSYIISPAYYLHVCTAALPFVPSTVVFSPGGTIESPGGLWRKYTAWAL